MDYVIVSAACCVTVDELSFHGAFRGASAGCSAWRVFLLETVPLEKTRCAPQHSSSSRKCGEWEVVEWVREEVESGEWDVELDVSGGGEREWVVVDRVRDGMECVK